MQQCSSAAVPKHFPASPGVLHRSRHRHHHHPHPGAGHRGSSAHPGLPEQIRIERIIIRVKFLGSGDEVGVQQAWVGDQLEREQRSRQQDCSSFVGQDA